MKLIKSIMSAFAIVLATTACAGNSGENKKSNEPTKKENKMEVIALNKADFLKKVYNYEANPKDWKFEGKRPAIVDFYATWCGPCRMQGPAVEKLAEEGYNVGKINVDDEGELAERYHVMNIPTLIIFKNGEEKERMVGVQSKDLLESKLKALA